ncbi:acetyltransferase-like protein 9 [Elsinoe australis]|uniref:Acetyltransferase-like protein 9 n=1 Tax=Elsinoe australis TaxID=40998 RepID=A0A4V6DUB0_9PEZI|nr:acetyltransferase-like protein 9 [Elsinoe australis]
MKVRAREESDLPEVAEVLRRVHADNAYPVEGLADPVKFLDPESTIRAWVLVDAQDKIIGHALISEMAPSDKRIEEFKRYLWRLEKPPFRQGLVALGRLFVDPSARGKGAGKMLVEEAHRWTAEKLYRRILLNVLLKDPAAIRLYENLGWTKYGEGVHINWKGEPFDQVYYISPSLDKSAGPVLSPATGI